jgi:hypothetical protein
MESHYKRLQRFFREFEVDYSEIAKTVVRLMQIPEPWILSCDRTEWQYGEITLTYLQQFWINLAIRKGSQGEAPSWFSHFSCGTTDRNLL